MEQSDILSRFLSSPPAGALTSLVFEIVFKHRLTWRRNVVVFQLFKNPTATETKKDFINVVVKKTLLLKTE